MYCPISVTEHKSTIQRALIKMLRPLVRILIRYGYSCSEFVELNKQLYVEVAHSEFALKDKKQSVSRVAILTGLSRKEVQKIKSQMESRDIEYTAPINRANRVILGWMKDSEFTDELNHPKTIPLRGNNASFEVLVKRYSGDITPRAILDELVRIDAVNKVDEDHLQLVTTGYIAKTEEEKLNVMAKCVRDQLNTIDFNFVHPSYESRFQRQIRYVDLPEETAREFKEFSKECSIEFITQLNVFLAEKKKQRSTDNKHEPLRKAGFGLYYFEEDNQTED